MSVHRNKGFTLIESLVVIVILSIVAMVAVPSIQMAQANSRVRSAASDLSAAIASARSEAAGRQRSISLTAEGAGWNEGWVMAFTVAIAGVPDLAAHRGMPDSVEVTADPALDVLLFLPSGLVLDEDEDAIDTVTFLVCDDSVEGERGQTVTLTRLGRTSSQVAAEDDCD